MNILTTRKPLLSLLFSQALIASAPAAVFNIDCNDVAGLIDAINTANGNSEADEINLNANNQANCVYQLTTASDFNDGANGLPSITTPITINGHQSTIQRQVDSPHFRIVRVALEGNLTLKQLTVENGRADEGTDWPQLVGGGIFNRGELTLEDSTVVRNSAHWGGGIYDYQSTATFTNSTLTGNTANWDGGGIYNSSSTATFTNSTVMGNSAGDYGGGIFNFINSTATLTNSTVAGNIANNGGGISNYGQSTTTLTNSTIAGNTANNGGGIANYVQSTTMITNNTITGNTANWNGSGIFNSDSTATLKNTILAGNTATTNCFDSNSGNTFTASNYNLFDNGTDCHAGETDLNLTALGKTIADVLNPTLANNGGPTQTLALVDNSPAIDAGDNTICADPPVNGLDQRGVARSGNLAGDHCDIGAYEYQQPDLATLGSVTIDANAIQWETLAELGTQGFYLWQAEPLVAGRCETFTNPQRVVSQLIPAKGSEVQGEVYQVTVPVNLNGCYGIQEIPSGQVYITPQPGIHEWTEGQWLIR